MRLGWGCIRAPPPSAGPQIVLHALQRHSPLALQILPRVVIVLPLAGSAKRRSAHFAMPLRPPIACGDDEHLTIFRVVVVVGRSIGGGSSGARWGTASRRRDGLASGCHDQLAAKLAADRFKLQAAREHRKLRCLAAGDCR